MLDDVMTWASGFPEPAPLLSKGTPGAFYQPHRKTLITIE